LDGGPPDDTPTAFRMCVVEPGDPNLFIASLFNAKDKARMAPAIAGKVHSPAGDAVRRVRPRVSARLAPGAALWTEPMFPKAEAFQSITGVLCEACAADLDSAHHRIARYLGVTVGQKEGTA
jgi:hypothetical protein